MRQIVEITAFDGYANCLLFTILLARLYFMLNTLTLLDIYCVRCTQVFADGTIATVVGFGSPGNVPPAAGYVDGVPATQARLNTPVHVALDLDGNWLISGELELIR